jgi:hypothetical protein
LNDGSATKLNGRVNPNYRILDVSLANVICWFGQFKGRQGATAWGAVEYDGCEAVTSWKRLTI